MSEVDAVDLLRRIEQYQSELAAATSASRAKSAFIAQMSRELRKPLNAILGYAQLLKRESIVSTEKLGDGLSVIERSGEQLLKLVDNMLDSAKLEAAAGDAASSAADDDQAFGSMPSRASAASLPGEIEGYAGQARTVLIADDDADSRALLTQLLESVGFVVHDVGNGFDALHWVRNSRPNLIITDLVIPVIDGMELVRILRAGPESRATPIIGMSANNSDLMRRDALAAGFSVFLPKPLKLAKLLEEIGTQLDLKWRYRDGLVA